MDRRVLALLGLTLLAFTLGLYRLDRQSLWYDEGFSVYLSSKSLAEITARTAADIHPPLYYYLLHFWLYLFGKSEFSLRFLSLLFGVLTVPLIYVVGRKLFDWATGLWVALFVAISPLYIWYFQEARMYTLLVLTCLLSTYLLLRLMEGGGWLPWLCYLTTNVVAVYAHFYAFFIVAFQGLFLVLWWLAHPRRWRSLVAGLGGQVATLVAYLPWSQFVLIRYGADVSYWPGTLPLPEVLRKTFILFSTGHSVIEDTAWPIAFGYGAVLLLALWVISSEGARSERDTLLGGRWPTLFLLLYLITPLVLLYAISYQRPKFHPRYLMLSSPAFFIIMAAGVATLLAPGRRTRTAGQMATLALGLVALLYVAGTSLYALNNLYYDPRFTKEDFRGVARYIEANSTPDEAVILTSGHLFPVFTYYYSRDNWYPLPDEPTLSTVNVLNYEVADDLNRILAGRRGVWVVLWQDEVVDPNGFLVTMLDEQANRLSQPPGFWGVRLLHYGLPEGTHFSREPPVQYPLAANFENRVKLLGYRLSEGVPAADEGISVTLYWQSLQRLEDDYKLALRLRDGEGHLWGQLDRRPAAYLYPTTRWKVGEKLFGKYVVPLLPGTPPGDYQLEATIYSEAEPSGLDVLDVAGAPAGKIVIMKPIAVGKARRQPAEEELEIEQALRVDFLSQLELLGLGIDRATAQPGDKLNLTLFWRALAAIEENYSLYLQLTDFWGEPYGRPKEAFLAHSMYPTSRWGKGEIVRGQYSFVTPVRAEPGTAQLRLTVVDGQGEPVPPTVVLTSIEVQATERVFTPPAAQYLAEGLFGGVISLYGYDLSHDVLSPGASFDLTLYWQAKGEMDRSYTVFTHLIDEAGHIWAQKDSLPVGGQRPTTGWVPGEFIADKYRLVLEADTPPGQYVIEVGLYDAATGQRLPAIDRQGNLISAEGRIILEPVILVVKS
ncbi:MAG: glycosyltransferase family 39 protein [Anaerolineae bacterium]